MIAACYVLHIYCDVDNEFFHEFTGRTHAECIRKAKKAGWRISADEEVCICPHCSKDGYTVRGVRKQLNQKG